MKLSHPARRFFRSVWTTALLLPASGLCAQPLPASAPTSAPATMPVGGKSLEPIAALQGRPDADAATERLGERYENKGAGISFRPPIDSSQIAAPNSDEVVEFSNDKKSWLLRVSKPTFPSPVPLTTYKDVKSNREIVGLLDYTVQQLQTATPGAVMLRKDVINVEANSVGMLAMRFTLGTQRFLRQQAIVQGNEQLYYIFNLTTPAGNMASGEDASKLPPDPLEKAAVEAFVDMVDTIKVIDRAPIKEDQNQRLFRTRALFLYWTPAKFNAIKVDKQYLRFIQDGKDVGYSYVEEMNNEPRLSGVDGDGAVVYERTHRVEKDEKGREQFTDVGSFKFMSFDRRREGWTRIVVVQTKTGEVLDETHTAEYAEGKWELKIIQDPENGVLQQGDARPGTHAPLMRPNDSHTLDVTITGKDGNLPPLHIDLPPFYLPASGQHFLSRLVVEKAYHEPRTYLFASYIPETRDIRMRYVDVSQEREVAFNGRRIRAVMVSERVGLEGNPTVHYVTIDGKYLGSENRIAKIMVLPSDEASILKLWPDAKLTRPDRMRRDAAAIDGTTSVDPAPVRGLPAAIR